MDIASQRQPLSPSASLSQIWWFRIITLTYLFRSVPSARHGDGLYDSYMRTDHILKDDADTNSPSGLPPMPKHTVSAHTQTHIRICTNPANLYFLCRSTSCSSEMYSPLSPVPIHHIHNPPPSPVSLDLQTVSVRGGQLKSYLLPPTCVIQSRVNSLQESNMWSILIHCPRGKVMLEYNCCMTVSDQLKWRGHFVSPAKVNVINSSYQSWELL